MHRQSRSTSKDEGFYLNTISQPWTQTYTHLHFGWIYHPLYIALNGSVAALRQANLLSIWLLATTLFALLLTACGIVTIDSERPATRYVSASVIGVGGWLCFMAKMSSAATLAPVVAISSSLPTIHCYPAASDVSHNRRQQSDVSQSGPRDSHLHQLHARRSETRRFPR